MVKNVNDARALDILSTFLHVKDDGRSNPVPVTPTFWQDLGDGTHPELDEGRLMSAFSFSEPWNVWERHPAGEELVLLISGAADLVFEDGDGERVVRLATPGSYVLVPQGAWHTARTGVPTTMLFLTPGRGTEHKPA